MRKVMVTILLVLAMVLGGCSTVKQNKDANIQGTAEVKDAQTSNPSDQTSSGDYYVIVKDGGQFQQTIVEGAKDAGANLGVNVVALSPNNETEVDKQISMVEQAINAKASGILIAPLEIDALIEPCKAARNAGIPVILVDSMINSDDYDAAMMTDNYIGGQTAADTLAAEIGDEGKVFVINAVAGSQSCISREDGFRDRIAEAHPNIEIVGDTLFCNNDSIVAANQAIDTLSANPDLKGFYAPNGNALTGVASGVKEAGKAGTVKVIGFDATADTIALLEEGAATALVVQMPYNMGYMGIETAMKIAGGEEVSRETINTGFSVVTADNMNDAEMQKVLYPLGK